jgi:hypothetical protein
MVDDIDIDGSGTEYDVYKLNTIRDATAYDSSAAIDTWKQA